MDNTIAVEIITPDETAYTDNVTFLLARASDGDIGILPGHEPLAAALSVWPVKVRRPDGEDHLIAVFGGFMEVTPKKITLITPYCELPEAIDVERAERAKTRAEKRLESRLITVDTARAERALRRSLVRLKVSGRIPL